MTYGNRSSNQAITRFGKLLCRAFSREATSCSNATIVILSNSNGSFTNEDQAFIRRCRGQRLLITSYSIKIVIFTQQLTSLNMSGRAIIERRLISRLSNDDRMASHVSARISGRAFAILLVRFNRYSGRFQVDNFAGLISFCMTCLLVGRVNNVSALRQGISASGNRVGRILFTQAVGTRFRLTTFFAFRTFRNFAIYRGLTSGDEVVCFCGAITYRRARFFQKATLGSTICVGNVILGNGLSASATRAAFRVNICDLRILNQGVEEVQIRFQGGLQRNFFRRFTRICHVCVLIISGTRRHVRLIK